MELSREGRGGAIALAAAVQGSCCVTAIHRCDALLVGAGIMGATLASLLKQLEPGLEVVVLLNNPLKVRNKSLENNYGNRCRDGSKV